MPIKSLNLSFMKTIYLLALSITLSLFSNAQTGTLKYAISIETSDPEMQMLKAMLMNSQMEIYYSPTHTAMLMRLGTMSMTKTISDLKSKKTLTIVESPRGNYFANSTIDENVVEEPASDLRVTLVNETKKIAGLDCKKALLFDKEGNEYTIWYVPQLNFTILSNFDIGKNSKIPGAMAEFEMIQEGFIMRFTLMSYSDKVDNPNAFDMTAPDGYTEMSAEVLKQFGL